MNPPVDKPESRQTSPSTSMLNESSAFSSLSPARDTYLGTSARMSISADALICGFMLTSWLQHSAALQLS